MDHDGEDGGSGSVAGRGQRGPREHVAFEGPRGSPKCLSSAVSSGWKERFESRAPNRYLGNILEGKKISTLVSQSGFQGLRYLVAPKYDKNALRMKGGTPACCAGFGMAADFALTLSAVPSLLGLVRPGSSGVGCSTWSQSL